MRNNQDVGENDGSVEVESSDWLKRDLASVLRRLTNREEIVMSSKLAEFWQIPSRLLPEEDKRGRERGEEEERQ